MKKIASMNKKEALETLVKLAKVQNILLKKLAQAAGVDVDSVINNLDRLKKALNERAKSLDPKSVQTLTSKILEFKNKIPEQLKPFIPADVDKLVLMTNQVPEFINQMNIVIDLCGNALNMYKAATTPLPFGLPNPAGAMMNDQMKKQIETVLPLFAALTETLASIVEAIPKT